MLNGIAYVIRLHCNTSIIVKFRLKIYTMPFLKSKKHQRNKSQQSQESPQSQDGSRSPGSTNNKKHSKTLATSKDRKSSLFHLLREPEEPFAGPARQRSCSWGGPNPQFVIHKQSSNFVIQKEGANYEPGPDERAFLIQQRIVQAKHEAKTVTVLDGDLYIDYKYCGPLPEGCRI